MTLWNRFICDHRVAHDRWTSWSEAYWLSASLVAWLSGRFIAIYEVHGFSEWCMQEILRKRRRKWKSYENRCTHAAQISSLKTYKRATDWTYLGFCSKCGYFPYANPFSSSSAKRNITGVPVYGALCLPWSDKNQSKRDVYCYDHQ